MTCMHPTVRFHQGGFRIECKTCSKWWVAIKMSTAEDRYEPDYTRAAAGLTMADERTTPSI
jgi:hypothetical protein